MGKSRHSPYNSTPSCDETGSQALPLPLGPHGLPDSCFLYVPPRDPTFGVLPDASPMAHLFSRWCGERGAGNGLEHRSLGLPLPHLPMGSTPHLSLRHCQLVLGFASSSSLLPFFLLLLLAVETLGVRSVMDSWLQQRLVSGIYWSTLMCSPTIRNPWLALVPGASLLSVTQAPQRPETEP